VLDSLRCCKALMLLLLSRPWLLLNAQVGAR
jgi:hypothetical protein